MKRSKEGAVDVEFTPPKNEFQGQIDYFQEIVKNASCSKGHLMTPENTRLSLGGAKHCKKCDLSENRPDIEQKRKRDREVKEQKRKLLKEAKRPSEYKHLAYGETIKKLK